MAFSAPSFRLSKWYFDVLDDSGKGLIAYLAWLHYGKLSIGYQGLIPIGAIAIQSENFFGRVVLPEEENQAIRWTIGEINGFWFGKIPEFNQQLLEKKSGFIKWQCLQPVSEVTLSFNSNVIHGMGYAEKIELTLPPWQLPILELYWGRYVSIGYSVVWIRWVGPEPRLLLFYNGKIIPNPEIDDRLVRFQNFTLPLPSNTVRKEKIGKSLFDGLKKMASLFPAGILSLHEEKWAGKATLFLLDKAVDSGHVIHEKVCWP